MADLLPWQVPKKVGNPYHGKIHDGAVHLPSGGTQPWSYGLLSGFTPIKLLAADAPAASTTPAETEAGLEWRNYLLYQAGGSDPYAESGTSLALTPADNGFKAIWLYTPRFGLTFRMRMQKTGDDYTLHAKQVGLINAGIGLGEQLVWSATVTTHYFNFADVIDGPGDRVLWMTSDKVTNDNLSVLEWVLTFDAETNIVSLAESVIDGTPTSRSTDDDLSKIRRTSWEDVTTEIGSYECGAGPTTVILHQTVRNAITVPLDDPVPYEHIHTLAGNPEIENTSHVASDDVLMWALYQGGVAKSVRMTSETNNVSETTLTWTIEGQSHEEEAEPCGSWTVVTDVPFKNEVKYVTSTNNATTSEFKVGGATVFSTSYSLDTHYEKTFPDGSVSLIGPGDSPVDGWDVESFSETGTFMDASVLTRTHPIFSVRTASGDTINLVHTFGTSTGDRLKEHSLNHVTETVSEEDFAHSWI